MGNPISRVYARDMKSSRRYRIDMLRWFTNKVWDISLQTAAGDWQLNLRTWNVVPMGAPIFTLCSEGDLPGVRDLLSSGRATLRDRTDTQATILSVSA